MAINSGLACRWRWRCTAMLLMLMLPSLFVHGHGARFSIEERQPQRTVEVNDKTVSSSFSSSSPEARSEFDDSDRLVPTGPNPLHHRHH